MVFYLWFWVIVIWGIALFINWFGDTGYPAFKNFIADKYEDIDLGIRNAYRKWKAKRKGGK